MIIKVHFWKVHSSKTLIAVLECFKINKYKSQDKTNIMIFEWFMNEISVELHIQISFGSHSFYIIYRRNVIFIFLSNEKGKKYIRFL